MYTYTSLVHISYYDRHWHLFEYVQIYKQYIVYGISKGDFGDCVYLRIYLDYVNDAL